jgi:hypothetical protein
VDHELHLLLLHGLQQLLDMPGRRRDTRLVLDGADEIDAVARGKVDEVLVVRHRFDAAQRRRDARKLRDLLVGSRREAREALAVGRRALGIDALEALGDRARHQLALLGVEIEVWIAERVELALRAVLTGRHLERLHVERRVDVGARTRHDVRVARRLEQRWDEGVLETEPLHDQRVGPVQLRHEGRLHRHLVGILSPLGDRDDLDPVAADLRGDVGHVGQRCDHAQGGRRRTGRGGAAECCQKDEKDAPSAERSHGCDSR